MTLLGTGAAIPSKYRNVSGIFIDLYAGGTLLMDCGEGSLSQLIRRFGLEGAKDRLARLQLVWISHFHADHHGGLYEVLRVRRRRSCCRRFCCTSGNWMEKKTQSFPLNINTSPFTAIFCCSFFPFFFFRSFFLSFVLFL